MNYIEITGNGTVVVKKSAGYIQGITVNAPGTTATLQVLDKNSDTGISANIAGGAAAFAVPAAGAFLDYDCHFSNGLQIVVAGNSGTLSLTVEFA